MFTFTSKAIGSRKKFVSFYHKNKITQALFPVFSLISSCPSCAGFYAESIIYYGFKFFCSCCLLYTCIEYMHHIITKIFMFVALSAVDNNSTDNSYSKNVYSTAYASELLKKQFSNIDIDRIVLLYFEVFLVVPSILKKCLGIYHNLILVVTHLIIFYVQNFQILK